MKLNFVQKGWRALRTLSCVFYSEFNRGSKGRFDDFCAIFLSKMKPFPLYFLRLSFPGVPAYSVKFSQ
jgi:hypothetical protein